MSISTINMSKDELLKEYYLPNYTDAQSMEILVEWLNKRTEEYDAGTPTVSDKDWDDVYFILVRYETNYPEYIRADSPTQNIHYEVVNELKKVTHSHPMLSLSKTKSTDEALLFAQEHDCIFMAKMDGLTVSLHYENGRLVSAETRGNGTVGEDVLHNALTIKNLPKKVDIRYMPKSFTVDGEVICTNDDFKPFAAEYKNPRNFASGSLRLLDANECKKRNLSFVAWDVMFDEDPTPDTQWDEIEGSWDFSKLYEKLIYIKENGFEIVPLITWTKRIDKNELDMIFKDIENSKEYFPIDGIVIKINDTNVYEDMGITAHHPKGALAYKFYDEEYETYLRDIEWGMGKTGTLTPIAIFDTVEIDGTNVERASLHNLSIVEDILGVPYYGQNIKVIKSNMIIPQVIWGEKLDEDNYFEIPEKCPYCGAPTKIVETDHTRTLVCTNDACDGRLVNQINHYCSKKGFDIKGLGEKVIEQLIDWGWLTSIVDIYTLKDRRTDWINKDGWGIASVDKILNNIEASKTCELPNFIAAIGIPDIGITIAKRICEHVQTYEEFRKMIDEHYDFTKWHGFSYETQRKLVNFNYSNSDKIYNKYITVKKYETVEITESPLTGKKIVITGKLKNFKTRDAAKAYFTSLGCQVVDTVTKNTFFLLNNDINSTTSKNAKAKQLGIPIYTEEDVKEKFLTE